MSCDNAWHRLNATYLPPDRSKPCPGCGEVEVRWDHSGHGGTNQGCEGDLRDAYEKGHEDGWEDGWKRGYGDVLAAIDARIADLKSILAPRPFGSPLFVATEELERLRQVVARMGE